MRDAVGAGVSSEANVGRSGGAGELLGLAVVDERGEALAAAAEEDVVDGPLARHVLDLPATQVEFLCQLQRVALVESLDHRAPNPGSRLGCGALKAQLVEEPTLECRVEVLLEVGGGNHDSLQALHLLQDDVLDGVFHLIDGILGTALAGAYHGVGLVEEEDGGELAALHRLAVAVEDGPINFTR